MFLLKKIVSPFLFPLTVLLFIQLAGFFLLWSGKRHRLGRRLIAVATLLLLLISFGIVPGPALDALENAYPPLVSPQSVSSSEELPVQWVVILGTGHRCTPDRPAVSRLRQGTLSRLVEGIRIYRELPGSRLLVSGGTVFESGADAEVMARAAMELGVPVEDIVQEHESRTTEDEARLIAGMVGKDRIILVTSAYHMPRSMALFKKQGVDATPAPADYLSGGCPGFSAVKLVPNPMAFEEATIVLRELLGIVWAKLIGRI